MPAKSPKKLKILIIGGGNMGLAYAKCLLSQGLVTKNSLAIVESFAKRRNYLKHAVACKVVSALPNRCQGLDVVIVAVKPQDMRSVCEQLSGKLTAKSLVISVMAGIKTSAIQKIIGPIPLIRCMPNLPASIRLGVTVYFCPTHLSARLKAIGEAVLGSTGAIVQVEKEQLLNPATAVSGSGPAYVFYLIEHLMQVAKELGFSSNQAQELVFHTLVGATHLWRESGEDAAMLRERVTSKKGTTFAAFKVFTRHKVGEYLCRGIRAANIRAHELAEFADS